MATTKIMILVPNAGTNALLRIARVYETLADTYSVEVVGFGESVFPVHKHMPMRLFRCKRGLLSVAKAVWVAISRANGRTLLIASKVRLRSFLPGLIAKYLRRTVLILDCDDWDASKYYSPPNTAARLRRFVRPRELLSCENPLYHRVLERFVGFADAVVVGSTFLAQRYQGHLLYHPYLARECRPSEQPAFKRIPGKVVFGFAGHVSPNKGVDRLAGLLAEKHSSEAVLRLAGPANHFMNHILGDYPDVTEYVGVLQPNRMEKFLDSVDVVPIFQQNTPHANGGVPAKLFDAMAAGKAIIASDVSDVKELLGGCGIVIRPGSIADLATAVESLIVDSAYRNGLGNKVKSRYQELFPHDYMLHGWNKVLHRFNVAEKNSSPALSVDGGSR